MSMEDYKKLVERLQEEPKDSRKAVLSIYDLCVDAAYAIESLLDKLKYAEGERDVVTKRMIELEQEVGRLRKERDAAVADLEAAGLCNFCGHWVHRDGKVVCGKKGKCEFVWRGPQKEALAGKGGAK